MNKKSINSLVIAVSLILVIAIFTSVFLVSQFGKKAYKTVEFEPGAPPSAASLNLTSPKETGPEAIAFAVDLYKKACENWKNLDKACTKVKSVNEMMGTPVIGNRYLVKNGEEVYFTEYSHIKKQEGVASIGALLLEIVDKKSTAFAFGKYCDNTMSDFYARRVTDPTPKVEYDEETNSNVYTVDWENYSEERVEKEPFTKNSPGKYKQTAFIIEIDTVLSATVKKVEPKPKSELAEGEKPLEMAYWEIVFELDPAEDKSASEVIKQLRKGAGDGAYYKKLIDTIHIWENGYFRYFRADDTWAGGPLGMGAELEFETFFFYDEESTNIENYPYMKELKELAYKAK